MTHIFECTVRQLSMLPRDSSVRMQLQRMLEKLDETTPTATYVLECQTISDSAQEQIEILCRQGLSHNSVQCASRLRGIQQWTPRRLFRVLKVTMRRWR